MKHTKKIIAVAATVAMVSASTSVFADYNPDKLPENFDESQAAGLLLAQKEYKITVNGKEMPHEGYIKDITVMLPVREIAEAIGFQVEWNQEAKRVELFRGPVMVTFSIGTDGYTFAKTAPQQLGVAPELVNDLTYVPAELFTTLIGSHMAMKENGNISIVDGDIAYNATISAVSDGSITVEDIDKGTVVCHIGEETKLIGADGGEIKPEDLKVGDLVKVEYSEVMTMSLPPQNTPVSITVIADDEKEEVPAPENTVMQGKVLAVGENQITLGEDLEDPNTQLIVNISDDETEILDKDGNKIALEDIKAGDLVEVTHKPIMTMSIPPQTPGVKVQVIDKLDAPALDSVKAEGGILEVGETSITIGENGQATYIFHIDGETQIVDEAGAALSLADLKKGMDADVFYNGVLTRSIPPQGTADKIVVDTDIEETKPAEDVEIDGTIVEVGEDRITISTDSDALDDVNNHFVLIVSEDTKITDKNGKALTLSDLKEGMEVEAVHAAATTFSIPPQSAAISIVAG